MSPNIVHEDISKSRSTENPNTATVRPIFRKEDD